MSWFKLEALTPVHIGSGLVYSKGVEFLQFPQERCIGIIDERKVLGLIGKENIGQWVSHIERNEDFHAYLTKRKRDLKAVDVCSNILPVYTSGEMHGRSQLRMHIKTANRALLPGSSLKGAIRTAVFAREVQGRGQLMRTAIHEINPRRLQWTDSKVQKGMFGKDPNHDIFRLLRVGDVAFDGGECRMLAPLNKKANGFVFDSQKGVYVECIPKGTVGFGKISFNKQGYDLIQKSEPESRLGENGRMLELGTLIPLVHAHNLKLLESEIARFQSENLPEDQTHFITHLRKLLDRAKSFGPSESLVRVGFGAGYKWMTGDWQLNLLGLKEAQSQLFDKLRRPNYQGLEFPKSRKICSDGSPLGFFKLSILEGNAMQAELDKAVEERNRIEAERAAEKVEADRKAAELEERLRIEAEEARKPQYFTGKIKQGVVVDAEYIGPDPKNARMKQFKCYVGGEGLEQLVPLSYAADLAVGVICQLAVQAEQKGKIQSVSFKGFK